MARYIKANVKVAQYLHLENDRNQVKDGNYLLWQADMLAFGRLAELPQILGQIGGIALAAHEAREEQDGIVVRKLPIAADSRFIVEDQQAETDAGSTGIESKKNVEDKAVTEQPAGNPDTGRLDSTDAVEGTAKTVRTRKNSKTVKITNEEKEV